MVDQQVDPGLDSVRLSVAEIRKVFVGQCFSQFEEVRATVIGMDRDRVAKACLILGERWKIRPVGPGQRQIHDHDRHARRGRPIDEP